jgi:AAA family ATP:ADP antiporter
MLSAGVVALTSLIYGHLLGQLRLRRLVLLTLFLLAASSAAMPWVMGHFPDSLTVFACVFLVAQVRGSLGTIQYSTLIVERFGRSKPERVVGIVGSGATLAGITMGMVIGLIADHVDVEGLMYLTGMIDLLTMLPVLGLRRFVEPPRAAASSDELAATEPRSVGGELRLWHILRSPYVLSITCVVTASVLASTLVEYQWKVTVAIELHRHEEELARYFGYFYGTVYLLTGLLQLFVTSRVLQNRGVLAGLLAFPGALLAATCTAWLVSAERMLLWPLTLSKGCDTLKRSLNDPSIQVVYGPLEGRLRRQAITFVAGIAKPFAEAVAAVTLLAATPWISSRQLSLVIIVLTWIWLALNVQLWRRFRRLRRASQSTKMK